MSIGFQEQLGLFAPADTKAVLSPLPPPVKQYPDFLRAYAHDPSLLTHVLDAENKPTHRRVGRLQEFCIYQLWNHNTFEKEEAYRLIERTATGWREVLPPEFYDPLSFEGLEDLEHWVTLRSSHLK